MTDHSERLHRGLRERVAAALALVTTLVMAAAMFAGAAAAAPYAAFVMDGRTGKEIYAVNADTPLHPASLTKMMTLYMAFAAVEQGKVRLDSRFTVSSHAASQPPSRLGLRPGQKIELRYLIRAAAVKSANDAATVIGEGLAGSEAKFGAQMTAMARALGMTRSNFRNANGLTTEGHYSSARDMTILGRRLFYDFPQYYNIFSRRSADAGVATVTSTNARFLDSYKGADGIKTGYTRAAGFNLTASAQRGSKRIIATVMGGTSTAQRNQKMAELLDAGFGRAPVRVAEIRPAPVTPQPERVRRAEPAVIARATRPLVAPAPVARPASLAAPAVPDQSLSIALAAAMASQPAARASTAAVVASESPPSTAAARDEAVRLALAASMRPQSRPEGSAPEAAPEDKATPAATERPATSLASSARPPRARREAVAEEAPAPDRRAAVEAAPAAAAAPVPARAAETVILASALGPDARPAARETIARTSSGRKSWGVSLGLYRSQQEAEQLLLKTALQEATTLDGALRNVANTRRGFEAHFVGLTRSDAALACEKLAARAQNCTVLGP